MWRQIMRDHFHFFLFILIIFVTCQSRYISAANINHSSLESGQLEDLSTKPASSVGKKTDLGIDDKTVEMPTTSIGAAQQSNDSTKANQISTTTKSKAAVIEANITLTPTNGSTAPTTVQSTVSTSSPVKTSTTQSTTVKKTTTRKKKRTTTTSATTELTYSDDADDELAGVDAVAEAPGDVPVEKDVNDPGEARPAASNLKPNKTEVAGSSHFMLLASIGLILAIALYVVYQKRKKILALVVEGRKTSSRRQTSSSATGVYKPVPTNEKFIY